MIFYIPIADDNLGGSIWIRHIGDTLIQMGHDVRYCHYESDTSYGDYTIIQSEWILTNAYKTSKKAIVLLGHFTKTVYPNPYEIRPKDIILTQWKGAVIEKFESESGLKTHYFPHAYFPQKNNEQVVITKGLWIGMDTTFRDITRFEGLPIEKYNCDSKVVDSFYRLATICPNVHLNVQNGKMLDVPESVIDVPGYAINERLFWIPGAGGFQIADENPLVRDFYDEDEVPMATAEDFKEIFDYYLDHPKEREAMAMKAHLRTMKEHLYEHRITKIMLPLL